MTTAVLCSADENRSWNIRNSLADAGVEFDKQYATSTALLTAVGAADDDAIDLIVVDELVGPMSLWDLVRELAVRIPSAAVIAVVDAPTPEDYSRAMDAGARSVIPHPLQYEDVAQKVASARHWVSTVREAVRRKSTADEPTAGGTMISLSSAKGGTGSTTIALHLALAAKAAAPEKSVVLVDLDLQKPDVGILVNAPQSRTFTDLLAVVEELSARQLEEVLFAHESGISVLFGPRNGEDSELVGEKAAHRILGMLRSRFDLVIVDTGSVMGDANSAAVEMADEAYIVATCDVLSLRGARRLAELWKRLGIRPTEQSRIILNRTDKRSDIQPEAAKKILSLPVVPETIPEARRAVEAAENRRDPSLVTQAWSQRIALVAAEMGIAPEPAVVTRKRSEPRNRGRRAQRRRSRGSAEAGQGSAEFIGVVFLIGVIAVIGFQMVLVGMSWLFASEAANEGARAAAVGHSSSSAAHDHVPAAWQRDMAVDESGNTVKVTLHTPLLVKITAGFDLKITASAGVVKEPRGAGVGS